MTACRARDGIKWGVVPQDVIPSWVADMDFPIADVISEAIARRAATDLGYPTWLEQPGCGPLADAFTDRMESRYGWRPDPGHVRTYTDLNQALQVLLHLTTRPGDPIALHMPAYNSFLETLRDMGRRVLPIPIGPDGRFEVPDEPAPVLLLINPQNPSGRVFTQPELAALAEYAERHDALVISDEIHADLVYSPARHIPFATILPERTVTLTSASKAFNMGGVHCAIAHIGAEAVRTALDGRPPHIYGAPGALDVEATVAAWRHGDRWLEEVLRILDRNRQLIAERLPSRVGYRMPEGTYLAWLDLSAYGSPVATDAAGFLEREARVKVGPGPLYGGGDAFVRLNFGTSEAILEEILARISSALA
ncbi:MalY/PatB family protein [Sphaerimonospora cavernae]|uniref:cysteine-S-conjugate beta-lyase n=1 Tax=Sphaerimonospora cavernae TaxID=1740611 RepID=A0ABV6TZ23_9ACTN